MNHFTPARILNADNCAVQHSIQGEQYFLNFTRVDIEATRRLSSKLSPEWMKLGCFFEGFDRLTFRFFWVEVNCVYVLPLPRLF